MGDIDYYIFALLLSNSKNLDNLVVFRAEEIDEDPWGLLVVVLLCLLFLKLKIIVNYGQVIY